MQLATFELAKIKSLYNGILDYKTFDLVPKVVGTDFGTRSKVLIMVILAFKTFNLLPKLYILILAVQSNLSTATTLGTPKKWSLFRGGRYSEGGYQQTFACYEKPGP